MNSRRRWLWLLATVGLMACGGPPREQPPTITAHRSDGGVRGPAVTPPVRLERVVIDASSAGGFSNVSKAELAHVVAYKRGRVELPAGYGEVALMVQKVVEGEHPGRLARVIVLDEVAHAMSAMENGAYERFAGRWTLQRLPSGTYIVSDLSATPFEASLVAHRERLRAKVLEGLRSEDPTFQTLALRSLLTHRFVEAVPHVIRLIDSTEAARSRPWLNRRHASVGVLAEAAIRWLTAPVADASSPAASSTRVSSAAWQRWWEALLATDPFPAPQWTPTDRTVIAKAAAAWPDLVVSPDGQRVFVETATRGAATLIDGGASRALSPPGPVTLEGHAWGGDQLAILRSGPGDGLKLGLVGRAGQMTDPSLGAHVMTTAAVAPSPKGWLLAYGTGPKDARAGGTATWIRDLAPDGKPLGPARAITLPKVRGGDTSTVLASSQTPWGHVAVGKQHVTMQSEPLVAFGIDGGLAWTTQLAPEAYLPRPRVASAGDLTLVSWTDHARGGEPGGTKLWVVGLRRRGGLAWPAEQVTANLVLYAATAPIPTTRGFALAWVDDHTGQPILYARHFGLEGRPSGPAAPLLAVQNVDALEAAHHDGTLLVFMHDLSDPESPLVRLRVDVHELLASAAAGAED